MIALRRFGWLVCFGFLFSASVVQAATVPYKFNGMNVTREAGVTHLRGTSPGEFAASGANVSSQAITASGNANWYQGVGALSGNGVVFNAVAPLAATAAAVAVTAIKLNPTGLLTSAVLSYVLSKGIEYANGQFQITVGGSPTSLITQWDIYGNAVSTVSAADSCSKVGVFYPYASSGDQVVMCGTPYLSAGVCKVPQKWASVSGGCPYVGSWSITQSQVCPAGTTLENGQCLPPTVTRPTVDADWDPVRTGYFPDAANKELLGNGVPLPVGPTAFTPPYKDELVGDPYIDPVTGKRYQDKARITPSVSDPTVADVRSFRQEVDANGVPVVDPVTGLPVSPEKEVEDPCKANPERVGCKDLGTPEDTELQTEERGVSSVTVQSFAGNATCPADVPLPKGAVFSWSYPCQLATGAKPFLLALAWLAAGMIVIGAVRNG